MEVENSKNADRVMQLVAKHHGLTVDQMLAKDRRAPVVLARKYCAIALFRLGLKESEIATLMKRERTTILNLLGRLSHKKEWARLMYYKKRKVANPRKTYKESSRQELPIERDWLDSLAMPTPEDVALATQAHDLLRELSDVPESTKIVHGFVLVAIRDLGFPLRAVSSSLGRSDQWVASMYESERKRAASDFQFNRTVKGLKIDLSDFRVGQVC